MSAVNVLKYPVSSPADTSPLQKLQSAGYDASQILAVIGKSEGNGCVNDFSRTLSTVVWEPLIPKSAVTIFSGGTEGVLSPHVTFIVQERATTGLVASVGRTGQFEPQEIGTVDQALQVSSTVRRMMNEAEVFVEDVKLVLVKCPLLTSAKMEAVKAAGRTPITTDTYYSMAKSRYASAVGVAAALDEISPSYNGDLGQVLSDGVEWSSIASCSSGAELEDCHILLLAESPSGGDLRAVSSYMKDAIDGSAITESIRLATAEGKVVQVFAKAEADPTGSIRGNRHTMNTDSDIQSTRHARAAVGGLIAGLTGDTQVYVSGGAEGQGPSGGGSLCVIHRR